LHGEIFEFPWFFFCLKMLFNVNGKATVWHIPCFQNAPLHYLCSIDWIPKISVNGMFHLHLNFVNGSFSRLWTFLPCLVKGACMMVIELSDIITRVGEEVHINRQPTNCGGSYYACVIQTVANP
jgi:hypothetical protein